MNEFSYLHHIRRLPLDLADEFILFPSMPARYSPLHFRPTDVDVMVQTVVKLRNQSNPHSPQLPFIC